MMWQSAQQYNPPMTVTADVTVVAVLVVAPRVRVGVEMEVHTQQGEEAIRHAPVAVTPLLQQQQLERSQVVK